MAMNRKPVVVVGSVNMDLVARAQHIPLPGETVHGGDFQTYPGGKGANQAVAVARLGYPVRMIGSVGSDAFGEELRTQLVRSGVDATAVRTTRGSSGVAVITVASNGENAIVVTPGANGTVSRNDIDENAEAIREAGVVLTQLEIPFNTVEYLAEVCERANVPLILDPAPARALPANLLSRVSWITPNETELVNCAPEGRHGLSQWETSEAVEALVQRCISGVVLKRGSSGAYLATKDGLRKEVRAFSVTAIDTTGAGDAFNGGFAVALMLGKSPVESVRFASAAGAVSVMRAGAQPSMPTLDEVNLLLSRNT